jgi:hypothetical protein
MPFAGGVGFAAAFTDRSTVDIDSGAALAQAMQQMNGGREWSPEEELMPSAPSSGAAVSIDRLRTIDPETGKQLQAALKRQMPGVVGQGASQGARYAGKPKSGPGPLQRQMDRAAAEREKEREKEDRDGLGYLQWQTRPVQAAVQAAPSPGESVASPPPAKPVVPNGSAVAGRDGLPQESVARPQVQAQPKVSAANSASESCRPSNRPEFVRSDEIVGAQ